MTRKKTNKVSIPTPVSEEQWRARDDANTLARAKEIMGDKKRMSAASKQAKVILKEKEKEVSSFRKILKKGK